MPVIAIINLANIIEYLTADGAEEQLKTIQAYQSLYGI
jgi:hypothetical protein